MQCTGASYDPVACFNQPMAAGPKNEPMPPSIFITARPVEAAGPCRKLVGQHMSGPVWLRARVRAREKGI